jgi:putative ABC transport system ATP-binding protein
MVTHDDRILDVADRIVTIRQGNIVSDAHVQETQIISDFLVNHKNMKEHFAEMPRSTVASIAAKMSRLDRPPGTTIIRQGDPGEEFYFIRSGTVRVEQAEVESGRVQELARLGAGDFFGEAALITGDKRNATVIADSDVVLYTLDKAEFEKVLDRSPSFDMEIRRALFNRQ